MRHLLSAAVFILAVLLMGCGSSTDIMDNERGVSTTYTISGTAFLTNGEPVVGVMGLWDITDSDANMPDYTSTISNSGDFEFPGLKPGRDYHVRVWITAVPINGWITDRSPIFYDLSRDETIHFIAMYP